MAEFESSLGQNTRTCNHVYMEDNTRVSLFSFHHVAPRDQLLLSYRCLLVFKCLKVLFVFQDTASLSFLELVL